jgi:hypothetical protein
MGSVQTQRTVVKSVPELWAELSEVSLLGPMLGHFGEIRITRVVPEETIEWHSELAAGRVELEPSGFGTRVRLSAEIGPAQATLEEGPAQGRPGLFARLWRRRRQPEAPQAAAAPAPGLDPRLAHGALSAVLDEIGAARHRPFSRALGAPPPSG